MNYTINLNGELTMDLAIQVLNELDEIKRFNDEQLSTYVEPQIYDTITLNLFSHGGILTGCMAIYDKLEEFKKDGIEVITYANGMVYSAAFILFLAGNKIRKAGKGTSFMWHKALLDLPQDNIYNQEDVLAHEKKMQEKVDKIVISKTNMIKEELDKNKKSNVWMTYEEALDKGVILEEVESQPCVSESMAIQIMKDYGYMVIDDEKYNELEQE